MLIYENTFPSTYDEIKTWYPIWYREVFEMDALWRVFGGQMDKIQAELVQMIDNNFIKFADAPTLTKLETFFGITHPFPRTLVERRTVLLGSIHSLGRMGRSLIIEIISLFTNGEIDVRFSVPGKIKIDVTRDFGDMFNPADIHLILGHRIPAHLGLEVIDRISPVRIINHNAVLLKNLFMLIFNIINTLSPFTIVFNNFHVKAVIQNYGKIKHEYGNKVQLNGQRILDGSFLLGGQRHTIAPLRGISIKKLDMGIYRVSNIFRVTGKHLEH